MPHTCRQAVLAVPAQVKKCRLIKSESQKVGKISLGGSGPGRHCEKCRLKKVEIIAVFFTYCLVQELAAGVQPTSTHQQGEALLATPLS